MYKFIFVSFFFLIFFIFAPTTIFAQGYNSFVNVVMPVRGKDFWAETKISPDQSFLNYFKMIDQKKIAATWLLRYDALLDSRITSKLKNGLNSHQAGIFLEVTPAVTKDASVSYHESSNWHQAGSVLLTGYEVEERKRIIDAYFEKFRTEFEFYPEAVGAWWIDAESLSYMYKKYGIQANLSVSDQFSTDGYQVWGQFWSTPFYPSRFNASQPAQNAENKIGVVQIQWAARDPYQGFGGRVEDSTFSVQANDYLLHPSFGTFYFSKLLDIYLKDNNHPFGQITIGIENDFYQEKYFAEFGRQLEDIVARQKRGEVQIVTMSKFAKWYSDHFPNLSPSKLIVSKNPSNDKQNVMWYSNLGYRAGLFTNHQGLVLKDLRLYSDTMEEPCLKSACQNLDLARITSKPLDEVTFRQNLIIEEGEVVEFKVLEQNGKVLINYKNILGKVGNVEFDKNDIYINGTPKTVAGLIIDTTTESSQKIPQQVKGSNLPEFDLIFSIKSILIFISAVFVLFIFPGRFILNRMIKNLNFSEELVLSTILGIGLFLAIHYFGKLFMIESVGWIILAILSILGIKRKISKPNFSLPILLPLTALFAGVTISILPVFKSGLEYSYGIGFWGPNGHDAIWHLSLIESLKGGLPPENYLFSGTTLTNYHYFFDLILAQLSKIPILEELDLYFRLWPTFLSVVLGAGIWLFCQKLNFKNVTTSFVILSIFIPGSWGWVVSFFRQGDFGGESMFWANQAISLHLNPPFALSLVILLGGLLFLMYNPRLWIGAALLFSLLWGIKAYAAVLILSSLGLLGISNLFFKKSNHLFKIFLLTAFLSFAILFSMQQFSSTSLFQFSPLWLIHSMTDSSDRLNWTKLSQARFVYSETHNFPRLFLAEIIGIVIFFVGNLGMRILGLPYLVKGLFSKNSALSLLTTSAFLGIFPTLLFIQKGNAWNIVQFFYYTMFAATLFSGFTINYISKYLKGIGLYSGLGLLLILSGMTTYSTLKHYFPNNAHSYISYEQLQALDFLKDQPDGVVLSLPFDEENKNFYQSPLPLFAYVPNGYISAFSSKPVFIADEMNLEILGIDYKNRILAAKEFFRSPASSFAEQLLADSNIKYIYNLKSQNYKLETVNIKKIFENSQVEIFEVI